MSVIEHISGDKSLRVKLVYSRHHNLRKYRSIGKMFPVTTQCLMFVNDQFRCCGEVVKHSKDPDDKKLGLMLATKKALEKLPWKEGRTAIWYKFHNLLDIEAIK